MKKYFEVERFLLKGTNMVRKKKGLPIHGWLIIDKDEGIGSTPIVGKVKRILNAQKAGHGGTLDPLASGLLPIALGEATKTVSYVMDGIKEYVFEITFGEQRTTDDREGEVIKTSDYKPSMEEIKEKLLGFIGEIDQTPPIYSAIKINGQRAYDLARQGADNIAMKSRKVHLYEAKIEDQPLRGDVRIRVSVSKGFYIRSLARDLAESCGSLGYVSYLRRTKCGFFDESHGITLEKLDSLEDHDKLKNLLSLRAALDDILVLALSDNEAQKVIFGQKIKLEPIWERTELKEKMTDGGMILALFQDQPLALMNVEMKSNLSSALLKTVRKFNLEN